MLNPKERGYHSTGLGKIQRPQQLLAWHGAAKADAKQPSWLKVRVRAAHITTLVAKRTELTMHHSAAV
jgi:hypothetical protein